jgi:RNA polymerase sigma-70 factor (ECF subfamily)
MSGNDRQLAARIASGDRAAFEEFLDSYGARVHRLARRYALHEADAEDLTQQIFCDLYTGIGGFRGESSLATWVYRVALNHCLRFAERARAAQSRHSDEEHEETPDASSDPARHAARRELRHQVHEALGELSPDHRTVVVLHELHGLTYGECAAILNVPVGTVKSRLSNAFRRLRTHLGGYVLGETASVNSEISPAEALGETA